MKHWSGLRSPDLLLQPGDHSPLVQTSEVRGLGFRVRL